MGNESENGAARIAENLKQFGFSPIGFADFAAWVQLRWGTGVQWDDDDESAGGEPCLTRL